MDERELRQRAAQLRQPHGEEGIKTAQIMNHGNKNINLDAINALSPYADDNILEIGMGNGYFVPEILSKHPSIKYTGCDFSELMVSEALQLNANLISSGRAQFVLSNTASMPFADNKFNKVFTVNTIYFWENEVQVLAEMKRVLQPYGTLLISFRPKHMAEKAPVTKYGFKLYTKEDVAKLLEENGYEVTGIIENDEPDMEINGNKSPMSNVIVVGKALKP